MSVSALGVRVTFLLKKTYVMLWFDERDTEEQTSKFNPKENILAEENGRRWYSKFIGPTGW